MLLAWVVLSEHFIVGTFAPAAHFGGDWSVDVFCDALEVFDR